MRLNAIFPGEYNTQVDKILYQVGTQDGDRGMNSFKNTIESNGDFVVPLLVWGQNVQSAY